MAKAVVDAGTCVACEACVGTCPVEAIAMTDGKAKVNPDTCIKCRSCVSAYRSSDLYHGWNGRHTGLHHAY